MKWFLCSAALDRDPIAASTYRSFLRSARRIAVAATARLDRDRPDVVVMLNGMFLFEAVVASLARARGVRVVTYERAHVDGLLFFAHDEPACRYSSEQTWKEIQEQPAHAGAGGRARRVPRRTGATACGRSCRSGPSRASTRPRTRRPTGRARGAVHQRHLGLRGDRPRRRLRRRARVAGRDGASPRRPPRGRRRRAHPPERGGPAQVADPRADAGRHRRRVRRAARRTSASSRPTTRPAATPCSSRPTSDWCTPRRSDWSSRWRASPRSSAAVPTTPARDSRTRPPTRRTTPVCSTQCSRIRSRTAPTSRPRAGTRTCSSSRRTCLGHRRTSRSPGSSGSRPTSRRRVRPGGDAGLDAVCAGILTGAPFRVMP